MVEDDILTNPLTGEGLREKTYCSEGAVYRILMSTTTQDYNYWDQQCRGKLIVSILFH